MRVYLLSDIHVDYAGNLDWLASLSNSDYRDDVLLLAGDVSDLPRLLERALQALVRKFGRVFFVPGNHELWVRRCQTADSLAKFDAVLAIAEECGRQRDPGSPTGSESCRCLRGTTIHSARRETC